MTQALVQTSGPLLSLLVEDAEADRYEGYDVNRLLAAIRQIIREELEARA